jgi:hypothetical protein
MEPSSQHEREVRAARNQALFRALNENLKALNEAFASVADTFAITCECADRDCIQMIEIHPHEYLAVRAEPRHFVVLPNHVIPEVETVVREVETYVVVEKIAAGGELAELLAAEANAEPS